jgi:hypothetical protein
MPNQRNRPKAFRIWILYTPDSRYNSRLLWRSGTWHLNGFWRLKNRMFVRCRSFSRQVTEVANDKNTESSELTDTCRKLNSHGIHKTRYKCITLYYKLNSLCVKYIYTGCPRRNVPDFRSLLFMLKYADIKNGVFWVVTPCGSCKNRRFVGTWCLLHQGDNNRWTRTNTSCN